MKEALEKAIKLLEEAREEIENCYGRDTDLTDRISDFLELYVKNAKEVKKHESWRDIQSRDRL